MTEVASDCSRVIRLLKISLKLAPPFFLTLWRPSAGQWWLGTELNRRHKDFQSSALPTELPSQPIAGIDVPSAIAISIFPLYPSVVYRMFNLMNAASEPTTVGTRRIQKAKRDLNLSKDGKWRSFPKVPNLLQYVIAGTY